MSEDQFNRELSELKVTCARLLVQLEDLRARIDHLEDVGAEMEPRPTEAFSPPPSPKPTPPITPPTAPPTAPPVRMPPVSRPAGPAHPMSEPASTKAKQPNLVEATTRQMRDLVHKLASRSEEDSDQAAEADTRAGLEFRIGGTWLNRVGAIVLFLALAFFVKYSFDQGWVSPALRVALGGLFGLLLVGFGEYCLHRRMRTFAAGVLGCGICVLYLSVYGAHGFYQLIGSQVAFFLYIGVTALSVGVAVHGRLLAVAILGLLGGFATPIVLSTGENRQMELLLYVSALDVCFLISASLRRWDAVRLLAWMGTVALFGGWALQHYDDSARWLTASFVLVLYLLFHAEALAALRRGATQVPRVLALIVHLNNAAFFISIYFLLREALPQWMGLFAVVTAGVQWLAAWRLCGPGEIAAPVRRSFWQNGAAMLALAAPMQFDRYMVSVSWAVQAVITLWFCRRCEFLWLRVKGLGVLVAAAAHLLIFEYHDEDLARVLQTIGHWHVSWLIVCFVFVGLCAYAASAVLVVRRAAFTDSQVPRDEATLPRGDLALAVFLVVFGTVWLLGIFADQWERYVATWWWLGLGVAWWALGRRTPAVRIVSVCLALATFAKFFWWDTIAAAKGGLWENIDGLVINRAVLSGIAVAAFGGLVRSSATQCTGQIKDKTGFEETGPLVTVLIALTLTWTGAFEVLRAFRFEDWILQRFPHPQQAEIVFITAFWAANAAVLWALCRASRRTLTSYTLVLTWLTLLKIMAADTLAFALLGHWEDLAGICVNRVFVIGLGVIAVGFWAYFRYRHLLLRADSSFFSARSATALLVVVTVLITWLPTFEISRVFRFEPLSERFADPRLATHVALSAFWSLNATVLLIIGFLRRAAVLRHLALGLFAVTVVKVFIVDLGHLETVYRIISFVVLGGLLMLASLLYQRLASRLKTEPAAERA